MYKQGCRSETSPNHRYSLNSKFQSADSEFWVMVVKFLFLIFSVVETSFKRFLSACRSWGQEKRSLCVGPVTKPDQCSVAETVGAAKTNRWGKIEKLFLLWKRRWPDGEMLCSNFIYNVILKKKKEKKQGAEDADRNYSSTEIPQFFHFTVFYLWIQSHTLTILWSLTNSEIRVVSTSGSCKNKTKIRR